ncbi:MAG: hypothetical protein NUV56_00605 [Candidatus Uhrbacteria bacterium]|nr:hypothetical protein [Candidatus Uhrbacteria bacterium]
MSVRQLRLGLSVDEEQFAFFEWMRKQFMHPADGHFPRFVSDLGMEGNVLHIPLLDLEIGNQEWSIEAIIKDLVRDDDRVVRPIINERLPNLRVNFGQLWFNSHQIGVDAYGTLPLAGYFAQGIVSMEYPEHCKVAFAHPIMQLGGGCSDFEAKAKFAAPTIGLSTHAKRVMLLDVTDGYGRPYPILSVYHFTG